MDKIQHNSSKTSTITILITFLHTAHLIHGFTPNIKFKIANNTIGNDFYTKTYKVSRFHETFPIPDEVINSLYMIENVTQLSRQIQTKVDNKILFSFGHEAWSTGFKSIYNTAFLCNRIRYTFEFDVDHILNRIFKCRNKVRGFIGRFYFLKLDEFLSFQVNSEVTAKIPTEMTVFWLVTQKDRIVSSNAYNYRHFQNECHKIYIFEYFYLSGIIMICVFLFAHVTLWIIGMRKSRIVPNE